MMDGIHSTIENTHTHTHKYMITSVKKKKSKSYAYWFSNAGLTTIFFFARPLVL